MQIILTWNLSGRDFTDREGQLLHLLGAQVAVLASRIEDRRHVHEMWKVLNQRLGRSLESISSESQLLSANEGKIISALIKGEPRTGIAAAMNWPRDTLDRHLGTLRERLRKRKYQPNAPSVFGVKIL